MQVIFGVLVMFTAMGMVSMVPAICRFNQNITCYGTLGEPLHLELPSEDEIKLMKNNSKILTVKGQNVKTTKLNQTRWQFIPVDRTIIITSTEEVHAGIYILETGDINGTAKGKYYLQLNVQAAVSSVEVKDNCLSIERTLSCSSEGDQLHFNWTLSGNTNPGNGNQTLPLEKDFVGNVTCHVHNHVSNGKHTVLLQQCPGTSTAAPTTKMKTNMPGNGTSLPVTNTKPLTLKYNHTSSPRVLPKHLNFVLIILGSLSVLLIVLSIIVCHVYKKKLGRKSTGSSQNGQELIYAKVTHIPNNNTKRTGTTTLASDENVEYATVISQDKKIADEVQYGEVVFNTRAKRVREQGNVQEECVYSHVQHGR